MAQIEEHRKRLAVGTLVGPRLIAVAGPLIAGPVGRGAVPSGMRCRHAGRGARRRRRAQAEGRGHIGSMAGFAWQICRVQ
jgi:hypothetical protein